MVKLSIVNNKRRFPRPNRLISQIRTHRTYTYGELTLTLGMRVRTVYRPYDFRRRELSSQEYVLEGPIVELRNPVPGLSFGEVLVHDPQLAALGGFPPDNTIACHPENLVILDTHSI